MFIWLMQVLKGFLLIHRASSGLISKRGVMGLYAFMGLFSGFRERVQGSGF